ncbi:ATP-dependent RNA helicase DbpA [Erwinia pyrifoliae]|uniref:ATP-dependent RNA helicase DbpA n=1 Tax=Erwinia pyrifoliae TaxID=79967 RepID=A0ABY5XDQ4_ERWPY|nr:ATP-dependent RNA helicase DbpA [Erwinia pyrifoliae]AUX72787.1 ATP-dependent RNA helicase DbpA [Erwinia pyrifoliae]MCA8876950.1 ATP-dependent RNA helicase DbpA [Erwinia pyrifoliae]MCT2387101.1 ATP-dependent RNA helicase DbpA [Erwinia pyrifoliae]MCU8587300.1 ATP-dependent RNA helicase DbpA [Erwinia pyrifoliae]UWS31157.1 ATP-dependent RNA helicase DbpA [Erwinia pyrifoliae]
MTAFSTLTQLPASQIDNLNELGYLAMTPVQAESLPAILAGRDVRAQAKTGSGKTAAFGLGVMHRVDASQYVTQALVLCPTRELADQVTKELRRLARFTSNIKILTLCGGQPVGAQRDSLLHAPHIVVGTPGRILDHLKRETLKLDAISTLVLDEADRMLEMGFREDIDTIISHSPQARQTLLFSATWPQAIAQISQSIQRDPLTIETGDVSDLPAIEQTFYEAGAREKLTALIGLLSERQPSSCVVFCNTKRECDEIAYALDKAQISAQPLHGDLEQRERDRMLIRFANGSCRVLVATDVAARGLDIKALAMVVNYQLSFDPEVHVHRIGRTARAGQEGCAVSFVAPDEMIRAHALEDYLQQKLVWCNLSALKAVAARPLLAEMVTVSLEGGRKAKIRPGDILGALTGEGGLNGDQVGKIDIASTLAYVAIRRELARKVMQQLQQVKIKGKSCRARLLK